MTSRLSEAQDELLSELADLNEEERIALLSGVSGIADVWRKVSELLEACDEIVFSDFTGKLAQVETAAGAEYSFLVDYNGGTLSFDAFHGHEDAERWLGRNRERLEVAYNAR